MEGNSQVEAFASWVLECTPPVVGYFLLVMSLECRSVLCSALKGRSYPALAGLTGGGIVAPRAGFHLVQKPFENCIASTSIFVLLSYKVPTVDALASTTDEGRVRLRKATVSCLESVTNRGCPNGETQHLSGCYSGVNT